MNQTIDRGADHPINSDFDPLGPGYLAHPYPYFAKFRREAPVFYAPKIDFWVVSRYEDVQNIVKDPETFSNVRVQEPPLHPLTDEARESLKRGVRVTPTTSTADPPCTSAPESTPRGRSRRNALPGSKGASAR